ncbi:MAG: hypothetical protein GKS06_11595 [Acidobacteria bacterium]|nr:hypothetical protein [Acidobacteriota bacterium]
MLQTLRNFRFATLLVSLLVGPAALAQDADALMAEARDALTRGDDAGAIGITTRLLDEFGADDSRALLARSLAHYRSGDLALAESDLSAALASPSRASDTDTDFRWPNDFMSWVASVRAVYAPDTDLPDIALDELNVAAPTRSVAAHFVMNVEVVRIPVIVEGWERNSGFMTGLESDDFSVVDGAGGAQPIRALIPEFAPTSIGLILDAGPDTEEIAPTVIDAVSKLLEELRPEDEVFIAQYGGETRFLSDFSTDRIALAAALAGYTAGPGRAMRSRPD